MPSREMPHPVDGIPLSAVSRSSQSSRSLAGCHGVTKVQERTGSAGSVSAAKVFQESFTLAA